MLFNLNGKISDKPFSIVNRSFKYGDGLFESMRIFNGTIFNLNNHIKRLSEGLKLLKINIPYNISFLFNSVQDLVEKNNISRGGHARLTVYRNSNGYYLPENNNAGFLIEVKKDYENEFILEKKGIKTIFYNEYYKPISKLSNIKTNNSLIYILGSIYARENLVDDSVLINTNGNIVETTNSNIFIKKNSELITPPLDQGPLNGTIRKLLIENFNVCEKSVTIDDYNNADEVVFTNIKGVKWLDSKNNNLAREITQKLNTLI